MKIKLIEPLGVSKETIEDLSRVLVDAGHTFEYYDTKSVSVEEQKARVEGAEVLMIANSPLPNEVVEGIDSLKMLSVAFTGIDHIGKDALKEKDVLVSNSAGYSDESVAELAIGLTIDVLRNMTKGDGVTRNSGTIAGLIGNELSGKTVGIVGTGRIGTRVAEIFKAFNCKLIAYAPRPSDYCKEIGVEYLSIEEVMAMSDIVSLHLPLRADTKGFISKDLIDRMKPSAILINCARGPVLDTQALADALNEGRIAGAGLDVYDMEPPIPSDYPLMTCKNTVVTPHVAYATEESMVKRAKIVFENVYKWLDGKPQNVMTL